MHRVGDRTTTYWAIYHAPPARPRPTSNFVCVSHLIPRNTPGSRAEPFEGPDDGLSPNRLYWNLGRVVCMLRAPCRIGRLETVGLRTETRWSDCRRREEAIEEISCERVHDASWCRSPALPLSVNLNLCRQSNNRMELGRIPGILFGIYLEPVLGRSGYWTRVFNTHGPWISERARPQERPTYLGAR